MSVENRHGSPEFYKLLEEMANTHDRKSHDYASNENPFGNYHFAGKLAKLFDNPDDAGFIGRIGEKIYRLANLENGGKDAKNEAIEDTEVDILTITALWMADRRERRNRPGPVKPVDEYIGTSREIVFQIVKALPKLTPHHLETLSGQVHELIKEAYGQMTAGVIDKIPMGKSYTEEIPISEGKSLFVERRRTNGESANLNQINVQDKESQQRQK